MKQIALAVCAAGMLALPLSAADESSYWPDSELKGYAAKLAPKINDQHFALHRFGDWGSHYSLMVHREGNGPAEIHQEFTDFYVVQSGEATLITGGKLVDPKTTEPGEIRAKSIQGGKKRTLRPGDTVNIPPKTPHQVVLESGHKITYLIVKIRAR